MQALIQVGAPGILLVLVLLLPQTGWRENNAGWLALARSIYSTEPVNPWTAKAIQHLASTGNPPRQHAYLGIGLAEAIQLRPESALIVWSKGGVDATRLLDLGTVYETRGMPSQALTLYRGADYLWQYPENSGMLHMHALCRRLRLDLSRLDEIGRNICSDIVADNHWIVDGQFANSELVAWAKLGEYQTGFVSYRSDQTTGQPPPSLEIRRNNLPLGKENGIYQFVPMQPGERVRFSAWFRIEKQGEFATRLLYVGWQDLQGRAAGNDGARIAQTTDWIFLEREFELISKTPQRVQFAPALFTGSATLWIDDVRLELLPK